MVAIIQKVERQFSTQAVAPTEIRGEQKGQMAQALGQGLGAIADMSFEFGEQIAMADGRKALSDFELNARELMYNPESGFMHTAGGNTTGGFGTAQQQLDALRDQALDGLSPMARGYAEQQITNSWNSKMQTMQGHTGTQANVYATETLQMQALQAQNNALTDEASLQTSFDTIYGSLQDEARLNGHGQEWVDASFQSKATEIHTGLIALQASVNPTAALERLRGLDDNQMEAGTRLRLEADLIPKSDEYDGSNLGNDYATSLLGGVPSYSVGVDFDLGPGRPNRPNQQIIDVIGASVEEVFGTGARVVITSGMENEGDQVGSNRHKHGTAADFKIIDENGQVVLATDPRYQDLARAGARNGALGIGFGMGYMSGSHMHMDLNEPDATQTNEWESGAIAMRAELAEIRRNRQPSLGRDYTSNDLARAYAEFDQIENPIARNAAITAFERRLGDHDKVATQSKVEAGEYALDLIIGGGDLRAPGTLTGAQERDIGPAAMTQLLAYQDRQGDADTDDAFYVELNNMAANNPAQFMAQDPISWLNRLNPTHWKQFTDMQRTVANGQASGALDSSALKTLLEYTLKIAKEPELQQRILVDALEWSNLQKEMTGAYPSEGQVITWGMSQTAKVTLNRSGLGHREFKDGIRTIDWTGNRTPTEDGDDWDQAQFIEALEDDGVRFDGGSYIKEELAYEVLNEMRSALGREPTPQEYVTALANMAVN